MMSWDKLKQKEYSPSLRYSFWGVRVSPQEPVIVTLGNRPHERKCLRIHQAILGELCGEKVVKEGKSSVVVSTSKKGECDSEEMVCECSLRLIYKETKTLHLEFEPEPEPEPPNDNLITFSVKGPRDIHLTGFFIHFPPAVPPPVPSPAPLPQQIIIIFAKHRSFETPDEVDFEQVKKPKMRLKEDKEAEVDHNSDRDKDKDKHAFAATTICQPYSPSPPCTVNIRNHPRKLLQIYQIEVEEGFDLEKAVCNHGFFMTPPNRWMPSNKSLRRPLRLADGCSSVMVSISSSPPPTSLELNHSHLLIHVEVAGNSPTSLSESDQEAIKKQVKRMLKLTKKDEDDVRKFKELHPEAKNKGFGRLFRSPDLFEDMIKTILFCNASWNRTLQMCQNLCELQAELQSGIHKEDCASHAKNKPITLHDYYRNHKNKHDTTAIAPRSEAPKATRDLPSISKVNSKLLGNFPTSKELAGLSDKFLQDRCQLGYRAKYVIQLAKSVETGKFKLGEFEGIQEFDETLHKEIHKKLLSCKGIGSFGAANIKMCMGDYRNIPTDSETIQHIREVHGMEHCHRKTVAKDAQQVYYKFGPYQCLAYWFEQVKFYERQLKVKLSKLSPLKYHTVAVGSYLSRKRRVEECRTSTERKRTKTRSQV